jgi:hypothetical protein
MREEFYTGCTYAITRFLQDIPEKLLLRIGFNFSIKSIAFG